MKETELIKKTILDILVQHTYDKPINEVEFIEKLKHHNINLKGASLRRYISDLVFETDELISSNGNGFYTATTIEEYEHAINWIKSRITPIVFRVKRMEEICSNKFGNQIEMEF